MPKRTTDHRSWVLKRLADPAIAASYLDAAISDSPDIFLKALRNVAEAHKMATVAHKAGVAREALYKTLSEEGNPRLNTLDAVLKAVGLRIAVEATELTSPSREFGGSDKAVMKSRRSHKRVGADPFPPSFIPSYGLRTDEEHLGEIFDSEPLVARILGFGSTKQGLSPSNPFERSPIESFLHP